MTLTYAEHQLLTGKRGACFTNGRMACDNDGNLLAYEFDAMFDVGAYNEKATKLVYKACHFYGYPYSIPSIHGLSRSGFSNNANAITYRGFGMPQVYTAGEAIIDMMAEKIGMDPFEFRYKNLIKPGDTIATNVCLDEYPVQEMMDMIRPYYEEAKKRVKTLSTDTVKRGVGVACGGYSAAGPEDTAEVALELNTDGTITHYNTWEQMGQGADVGTIVHTHEALRPLGIHPDQIKLNQNDSAYCPNTGAAAGSRSHYMAGLATIHAANQLMDAMRKPDGTYRTYDEMVAENIPTKYIGRHVVASEKTHLVDDLLGVGRNVPEFNYIVMVAEVEVEVKTGKSRCIAARGVANIGIVGNYLAVEGQAYGGFQHCVGFALTEDYSTFDPKYASMAGCGAPTCNDIPDDLEFEYHITPRPDGPFGSIGCSENFQSCGHMAVINAINNAVGVRIYELPATPNKILAGMKARAEGKELKPNTYDFGDDFYEVYDKLTKMAEELEKNASAEHQ
jgi:aldehyde oxidoreductase